MSSQKVESSEANLVSSQSDGIGGREVRDALLAQPCSSRFWQGAGTQAGM